MLLTAALLCLATAASAPADEVLARVDATSITRADLDERLRVLAAARVQVAPAQALSDLVDEALLAAEARRVGLEKDRAVVEDVQRERRRLLEEALLARLAEAIPLGDAQLMEMYHASADQLRLTLVKVATEAEAKGVLERARKGGDLAKEARAGLDPALAARGGDTGTLSRAAVDPALADAAFKAKVGDLVGPVALKLGFGVARVVELQLADPAGFPARRAQLEQMARSSGVSEARAHLVQMLRRASGVALDEQFLESLGDRVDATPDELAHVVATVHGEPLPFRIVHADMIQTFGRMRSHGAGPRARIELAWKEIDGRLLAHEAVARGLDRAPSVRGVLPGIERNVLAGAVASRIGKVPDLRDPAVKAKVDALRAKAKVEVQRDRVAGGGAR
jgi:hypothetical protein